MAVENLKSASITNADATPVVQTTSGMGAPARAFIVDDYASPTAANLATATSTYRLCRFPTFAKIKSLVITSNIALDTAGPTLVFDVNVIFSDSTVDGTPPAYQNLIPTTANTGATTTLAAYASPNKLFGTITLTSTTAKWGPTEQVYGGISTTYPFLGISMQPLWQTFGFVDGRGNPMDPGGYFDILLYVSTGATTGAAGAIHARLTYVA